MICLIVAVCGFTATYRVGTCCRGGFRRAFLSEGHGTAMRESKDGAPPTPQCNLQFVIASVFMFYKSGSFQIILVQFGEFRLIFFQFGFQMVFYVLAHIEITELGSFLFFLQEILR